MKGRKLKPPISECKNALLLFTKPPIPGLVKTRLTPIKDGFFSPEVAAWLYHCMFFDVVEICCDALRDLEREEALTDRSKPKNSYDIFISTTPADNVCVMEDLFSESGEWPRRLHIISDSGASFDEHYNDAFNQVFAKGYDTILSMGCDMPALPKAVVVEGFERLHDLRQHEGGGIVLSPDQEMGVSIIGWTRETDFDHTGVFYNQDGKTVLPAYIEKAQDRGLCSYLIPAVPDVDTMRDLAHNATLVQAVEYCAQFQDVSKPWRTIDALKHLGYYDIRVAPNELRDAREGIDAPQ